MVTFLIFTSWLLLNMWFIHKVDRNSTSRHTLMLAGYLGVLVACGTVLLIDRFAEEEILSLNFLKNFIMVFGAGVSGNFIVHAALTTSDQIKND